MPKTERLINNNFAKDNYPAGLGWILRPMLVGLESRFGALNYAGFKDVNKTAKEDKHFMVLIDQRV
jgi:hypothetical protein